MHYRSIADLSALIRLNLNKIPRDIDLIVGIPRSGMLAASILALNLNKKVCELPSFLAGIEPMNGNTRGLFTINTKTADKQNILVIDDSIHTGTSMKLTREQITSSFPNANIIYCAVYATPESLNKCDIIFEVLDANRAFEWNLMHRRDIVENSCFDIDGVLCLDPSEFENDDGLNYIEFILGAQPLILPTHKIGYIVTTRLEKYRPQTKEWLSSLNIKYDSLYMLDLPSASERLKMNCHADYKASIYKSLSKAKLFIESERDQSLEIFKKAGKSVLCFESQELFNPQWPLIAFSHPNTIIRNMVKKLNKN